MMDYIFRYTNLDKGVVTIEKTTIGSGDEVLLIHSSLWLLPAPFRSPQASYAPASLGNN